MNGAYAIPMRFMSRWKWENIWLLWTVLSLWAIPIAMTWAAVPHPIDAYQQTSLASLLRMGLMGLLWGAGVLLLGMSFPLVGVAVGAAVGLGCAAAMGTLLPILYTGTSMLQASTGLLVTLGVVMVLIGVGVCGFAGRAREQHQGTGTMVAGHSLRGFLYAGVGGTLTAALNLALAAGATITASVAQQHPILLRGKHRCVAPSSFGRRHSRGGLYAHSSRPQSNLRSFRRGRTGAYWPLVVMMGLLWLGSIVVYGNGVTKIGALGSGGWMAGVYVRRGDRQRGVGLAFRRMEELRQNGKNIHGEGVLCLMIAITILSKAGHRH